jgi:hypothetical protein
MTTLRAGSLSEGAEDDAEECRGLEAVAVLRAKAGLKPHTTELLKG